MLKGPLASLERHDRPAFEGRSGSERSTEPGSSAKTVASQPVVGYRIRSRTAKKEILAKYTYDMIAGCPETSSDLYPTRRVEAAQDSAVQALLGFHLGCLLSTCQWEETTAVKPQ